MTDDEIIEHCLQNVTEEDPACEVPDGVWAFTDAEVRTLLGMAVERTRDQMLDPKAVGTSIGLMAHERDKAVAVAESWREKADELQRRLDKAHRAIMRLGSALADESHQWTHGQRQAWEQAERTTRDRG